MSRDRLLNTQIVVLSNLNEIAIKRLFSHQAIQQSCIKITYSNINPWFITGFADGESCFSISIIGNKKSKTGWVVKLVFKIALSQKDIYLLENIKNLFAGYPGRKYL